MTRIKAKLTRAAPDEDMQSAVESWLQKQLGPLARKFKLVSSKSSDGYLVYEASTDIDGTKVGIGIEFEW